MPHLRRVVLDVLKPHEPSIVEFARRLSGLPGIAGVNLSVYEVDTEVENVKLTLEGSDVPYERVVAEIRDLGGTVHSVDEAAAGDELIEESPTHQD
jgi:hypothetical protein